MAVGGFKMAARPTGLGPQNTGASSVDHDVDMVVGRDSALRLNEMNKRQEHKKRVMHANHLPDGERLSRLSDGDYFVMTEEEKVAAKRARKLNQEAQKLIEGHKAKTPISDQRRAAERAHFLSTAS
jgi:hypothetical protein